MMVHQFLPSDILKPFVNRFLVTELNYWPMFSLIWLELIYLCDQLSLN